MPVAEKEKEKTGRSILDIDREISQGMKDSEFSALANRYGSDDYHLGQKRSVSDIDRDISSSRQPQEEPTKMENMVDLATDQVVSNHGGGRLIQAGQTTKSNNGQLPSNRLISDANKKFTVGGALGAAKDIGEGLVTQVVPDLAVSAARLIDNPDTRNGALDPFISRGDKRQQAYLDAPGRDQVAVPWTNVTRGELRSGLSSLGFSGASMLGSALGGKAGQSLGALAGSEAPLVGNLTGAAIGAGTGRALGGGLAAYKMDKHQFTQQFRDFVEQQKGRKLTDKEWKTYKAGEIASHINKHALHEAGWEGLGNAISLGLLDRIGGKSLGKKALKALAGFVGVELGGEAQTQIGQTNEEVALGMQPKENKRSFLSIDDQLKSAREVAPAVALMGGVTTGGKYAVEKFNQVGTKDKPSPALLHNQAVLDLKKSNHPTRDLLAMKKDPEALAGLGLSPADVDVVLSDRYDDLEQSMVVLESGQDQGVMSRAAGIGIKEEQALIVQERATSREHKQSTVDRNVAQAEVDSYNPKVPFSDRSQRLLFTGTDYQEAPADRAESAGYIGDIEAGKFEHQALSELQAKNKKQNDSHAAENVDPITGEVTTEQVQPRRKKVENSPEVNRAGQDIAKSNASDETLALVKASVANIKKATVERLQEMEDNFDSIIKANPDVKPFQDVFKNAIAERSQELKGKESRAAWTGTEAAQGKNKDVDFLVRQNVGKDLSPLAPMPGESAKDYLIRQQASGSKPSEQQATPNDVINPFRKATDRLIRQGTGNTTATPLPGESAQDYLIRQQASGKITKPIGLTPNQEKIENENLESIRKGKEANAGAKIGLDKSKSGRGNEKVLRGGRTGPEQLSPTEGGTEAEPSNSAAAAGTATTETWGNVNPGSNQKHKGSEATSTVDTITKTIGENSDNAAIEKPFRASLKRKGTAVDADGVSYSIQLRQDGESYYVQYTDTDGIRGEKGPGGPARWSIGDAIEKAVQMASLREQPAAEPVLSLTAIKTPRGKDLIIIKGNTKAHIDRIKAIKGRRWNRKETGWTFRPDQEAEVRAALGDLLGESSKKLEDKKKKIKDGTGKAKPNQAPETGGKVVNETEKVVNTNGEGLQTPVSPEAPTITKTGYGANNKLVSNDRAEELRAKLRAKLNQLSSGIDPELLALGTELAVYHVEAGTRKFSEFTKTMMDDFGEKILPYLRSFYEGARYFPEFDNTGMSDAAEIEKFIAEGAGNERTAKESSDGGGGILPVQDSLTNGKNGNQALEGMETEGSGRNGESGEAPVRRTKGGGKGKRKPAKDGSQRGDTWTRSRGDGSETVHPPATGTGSNRRDGRRGGKRKGLVKPDEQPKVNVILEETPAIIPAANFEITDDVALGKGGETVKYNDNIAAIETLKKIEAEQRRATPAEQKQLARYVGWGGLPGAFKNPITGDIKKDWEKRVQKLESLLTPDELDAARNSTQNAHYTSPDVVRGIWDAVKQMGFKSGNVLEPSVGTGNFIGMAPDTMQGVTNIMGVELDPITSRIAQNLYSQSSVINSGFEKLPLPDNSFDIAIGNPPFGKTKLNFPHNPDLNRFTIHNQFFLASMDALKHGGVQAMVVSRYLMDAKDSSTRKLLARDAKLLGAIRLPDTAFKENARTDVVTDIIFLQKKTQAELEAEQELRDQKKPVPVPDWVVTVDVADPLGDKPMTVNKYFADNPDSIIGIMDRSGSMRFGKDITVHLDNPEDLPKQLSKKIKSVLPKNIIQEPTTFEKTTEHFNNMRDAMLISLAKQESGSISINDQGALIQVFERETEGGDFILSRREVKPGVAWSPNLKMDKEGGWFRTVDAVDDNGNKVKTTRNGRKVNKKTREVFTSEDDLTGVMRLSKKQFDRLMAAVEISEVLQKQVNLETTGASQTEIDDNRKELSNLYKDFRKVYGFLNDIQTRRVIDGMPNSALLRSLEHGYKKPISARVAKQTGVDPRKASARPAAMLAERVIYPYSAPDSADTAEDALAITLSESGVIDLERVASLLHITEDDVIKQLHDDKEKPLIFKDPETQVWETSDEYLSGNVARKLEAAKAANIDKNIEALEKVQPEPWTADKVTPVMGGTWIPEQDYSSFMEHLLGESATVHFAPLTNTFSINGGNNKDGKAKQWSTERRTPHDLVNSILNSKPIKVTDTYKEGGSTRTVVNQEQTDLAQAKAEEIKEAFDDWIFQDADRRNRLVDLFNRKYNTRVTKQRDGSHLKMPGKVPDAVIKLRRHQMNAVWRGIVDDFVLYDHAVGAGKTFTGIARAMERRRMGLSKKPMIVVPNHMVEQFAADVYELYPGAKVLAATKKDTAMQKRRQFMAKIATGDWDIVIMPHSSFGFIGISPETEKRYLKEELELAGQAIKEATEQAEEDGWDGSDFRKPMGVKEAERIHDAITVKLEKLSQSGGKKDRLLTFEQLGVDDLTIDECFTYNTLIETNIGVLRIGDIVENKLKVLIKSFDFKTHAVSWKPVINWFKNKRTKKLVEVKHERGSFICTAAHKVWTSSGYKEAGSLSDGETIYTSGRAKESENYFYHKKLSGMRKGVHVSDNGDKKQREAEILFRKLHEEGKLEEGGILGEFQEEHGEDMGQLPTEREEVSTVFGADEKEQPDGQGGCSRKGLEGAERKTFPCKTRGERYRADGTAKEIAASNTGIEAGVCCENSTDLDENKQFAESLQNRPGYPEYDDSGRDRRLFTQVEKGTGTGQEKGRGFRPSRVEGVAILEPESNGRYGFSGEDHSFMYDIEVEGTHNYYANGVLVSNCHEFKNLFYHSKLNVRGMNPKQGSGKAYDLWSKIRTLRESDSGSVAFMTGTPISNSAVEMYGLMRYLAADDLEDMGLSNFDAWRTQFTTVTTKYEPTESGRGLKEVSRIGRDWSNMRSLMDLYYSFSDSVSNDDIKKWYSEDNNGARFPLPRVKGGGRQSVNVNPTKAQESVIEDIVSGFGSLDGIKDIKERNAERLRLMDRARKVSLDVRAVDPTNESTEEGGKLEAVSDNVTRIYKETSKDKGTQLIFLDRGVPKAKGDKKLLKEYDGLLNKLDKAERDGDEKAQRRVLTSLEKYNPNEMEELRVAQKSNWNAYQQIKDNLVENGIPENEIRFIQEANTDEKKQEMFDQVNSGTVRVLIGSTPRMGAGTNVQERLVALHHGDVTWKPSDIEQREGRIIRQGNKLYEKYGDEKFEVEIIAYTTDTTVDAKLWSLNSTKLKMINGIRNYNGDFNMEFEDEDSLGMAEIAAIASGEPLQLERIQLAADVDRLQRLKKAFARQRYGHEDSLHWANKAMDNLPGEIEEKSALRDHVKKNEDQARAEAEKREVTIEGETYSWGNVSEALFQLENIKGEAKANKEKFRASIDGNQYKSFAKAEDAVLAKLGDGLLFDVEINGKKFIQRKEAARELAELANNAQVDAVGEVDNQTIAMIKQYGLDIDVVMDRMGKTVDFSAEVNFTPPGSSEPTFVKDATMTIILKKDKGKLMVVNIKPLFDKLNVNTKSLSTDISTSKHRLEKAKKDQPELEKLVKKPYKKEQELEEKQKRLAEVEAELSAGAEPVSESQANQADDGGEVQYSVAGEPLDNPGNVKVELENSLSKPGLRSLIRKGVLEIITPERARQILSVVGGAKFSRENKSPWPDNFPNAKVHTTIKKMKSHADYDAAKGGDVEAAIRLVNDLVKPKVITDLYKQFPNAMVVAPHAIEEVGKNAIPRTFAEAMGDAGFQVDTEIVQSSKAQRTNKKSALRLAVLPRFDGKVEVGQEYIIVDDAIGEGGTVNELRHHIESSGGKVVFVSALTQGMYAAKISVKPETIKRLEERYGRTKTEQFIREFNTAGTLESLTEKQARTILRSSSLDSLRDRILTQAREAGVSPGAWQVQASLSVDQSLEVKYSSDGKRIEGFILNGKIYLIDGNIAKGQAMPVLMHELSVHARNLGFQNSKDFKRVLTSIKRKSKRNTTEGQAIREAMARIPADTGLRDGEVVNKSGKVVNNDGSPVTPERMAKIQSIRDEETLAYLISNGKTDIGVVRRFFALLKKFLVEKLGFTPRIMNEIDLSALALSVIKQEVKGKNPTVKESSSVGSKMGTVGESVLASISDQNKKFRQQLEQYIAGDIKQGRLLQVGETPEVLTALGAKQLPITVSQKVIDKVLHGKHGSMLSPDELGAIPGKIADPIAVFESKTHPGDSLVVMLDLLDKNGDTVVVPVFLDKLNRRYRVNAIGSVYGKDKDSWFGDQIKAGRLRYINKQKSRQWHMIRGLQLPKMSGALDDSSVNRILTEEDIVNYQPLFKQNQFQTVTMDMLNTPEFKKWFGKSKVKYKSGKPVWLYHGSPTFGMDDADSWAFNSAGLGKNTGSPLTGIGHFFALNKDDAMGYSGGTGNVKEFYVRLENPLVVESWKIPQFDSPEAARAWARQQRDLKDHDGLIITDEEHVVVFDNDQVKSAEVNTGDFDQGNHDVRYSVASPINDIAGAKRVSRARKEKAELRKKAEAAREKFTGWVTGLADTVQQIPQDKADMTVGEKLLSSAEYFFRKSGATRRMFEAQMNRRDNKYLLENFIFGKKKDDPESGFVNNMQQLKNSDPEIYKASNNYLLKVDKTGSAFAIKRKVGYAISDPDGNIVDYAETKDDAYSKRRDAARGTGYQINEYKISDKKQETWLITNPKGKMVAEYDDERGAVAGLMQAEAENMKKRGFRRGVIDAVMQFRSMTNRSFDMMVDDLRQIIKDSEDQGLKEPTMDAVDESKRWGVFAPGAKTATTAYSSKQQAEEHIKELSKVNRKFARYQVKRQQDKQIQMPLTLSAAIAKMGDMRGAYFPRQRKPGGIIAWAENPKTGEKFMKKFDLYAMDRLKIDPITGEELSELGLTSAIKKALNAPTSLARWDRKMKRKGFTVQVKRDENVPESVFDATKLMSSVDALLNESLSRAKKEEQGENEKAALQINKILTSNISDIFKTRGFLSSRMKRTDEYWQGFEEDMLLAGTQYAKSIAGGISKRHAARQMTLAVTGRDISFKQWQAMDDNENGTYEDYLDFVENRRLDPGKQKKLHAEAMKWMQEILRNDETADRVMGALKGAAVLKFLGFRVSSAAVNMTNMVQAVPATISSHTGGSLTQALRAVKQSASAYGKYRTGKGNLAEEDRKIFLEISDRGWDEAQFNHDAAGVLQSQAGKFYNDYLITPGMYLFGAAEKANRAMTLHAAYKQHMAHGNYTVDPKTGISEEAMKKAKLTSDRAHGVYGKETAPSWTRGAYNPLKLAYTFQKFSHNYLLNAWEMGYRKSYKQAMFMLFSPALLAGAGASLPISAMFATIAGMGGGDDPEEDYYDWLASMSPSAERFGRHGLAGLAGVNLKGSLQINNPMPRNLKEVAGAPGAVITDTMDAFGKFKKGEIGKGIEKLLPTGISSPIKAIREYNEGITSSSYSPVYYGSQPLKGTAMDAALRFFSFNPSRLSGIREKQWHERQVQQKYQKRRSEINAKVKHAWMKGNGKISPEDWAEIKKLVLHYNEQVKGSSRRDLRPITNRSLRQVIRRAARAPKRERMRRKAA